MLLETPARSVGACASGILAGCGDGVVHSVFTKAVYIAFEEGLVALVDSEVPNGPLHIRVDEVPRLRVGQRVTRHGGDLSVGSRTWRLPAPAWVPEAVGDVRAATRLLVEMVDHQPALDVGAGASGPLEDLVGPRLRRMEVARACALVFGRGAGLTPAGDDAAAGIILVHALIGAVPRPRLDRLAREAPTHAISRAFLRCAAVGYSLEPIHDAVRAAALGDRAALRGCVEEVARVGSTSGLDVLAGIRAALVAVDEAIVASPAERGDHRQQGEDGNQAGDAEE